jgi:hypothetical protein
MAMHEHVDGMASIRARIRALLEDERQRLQAEIRSYPTPIPRCDQQFNHLIARRELVCSDLARLDAAADNGKGPDGFIDSFACLDPEAKLRLKAALGALPIAEMPHATR